MAIYKKLLEIQKRINGLGKDTKGFNYQYVSGSKVLGAIKPLMNEQGLILKQEVIDVTSLPAGEKDVLFTVNMRFTWVDVESGETDVNTFAAAGCNGKDKGIGSALTYAERYFLLKYFHIATDEDDVDYYEEPKAPAPATKVETGENKKELEEKISLSIKKIKDKYNEEDIENMLLKLHKKDLKQCTQSELRNIYFKGVI